MGDQPRGVEAEYFHVVDGEGRVRMSLGVRADQPAFELLRRDGSVAVAITLLQGQEPIITLRDTKGRDRLQMRLYEDDEFPGTGEYPSVALMGRDGCVLAHMTATPHDFGEIGTESKYHGTVLLNEIGME